MKLLKYWLRKRSPPTAPPTMVPRLPSGRDASVGEVKRELCLSGAVLVSRVSMTVEAEVRGAAVVGGGSGGVEKGGRRVRRTNYYKP